MTETTASANPRRASRAEKESAPVPAEAPAHFQPQQYLETRDGLPYLPLKWRLAWLRSEHPHAKIATKLVNLNDGVAVFRAEIQLPGGGTATGWGVRSASDYFSREQGLLGYITAAENQALGRALAALGFGTEYAYDFDPPVENQAIVLPETPEYDSDEEGIELPITINVARESNGSYNPAKIAISSEESDEDLNLDDEDEDDEDAEDDEPNFVPKGEIRILNERPAPAREPEPPAARERPAPAPRSVTPAPIPTPVPTPAPGSASQAVEDRLKNVRDDALRVSIKRIYYEARQRFGYDEERVDNRSREIYKKPTYELDAEEADNYFERILAAAKRRPTQ